MSNRLTDAEFRQRVYNKVGTEYTFLEPYRMAMLKILVLHSKCSGVYAVEPVAFLSNGVRCPDCSRSAPVTNKRFRKIVRQRVGFEYIFLTPYKRRNKLMKVRHLNCLTTFQTSPENFLYNNVRCPSCT